jgi:hypothetical protein
MVCAIRSDHLLGGTVAYVELAVQDLSPVEIPDPDPFRFGLHGKDINMFEV